VSGQFIWYELLTNDADAAKQFYDSVVGWNIASTSDFPNDYRMIGRYDGKFAGGVMPLTDAMREHGARPTWLGYIHAEDVDATAAAIAGDGGQILMAPFDIPNVGRVAMVTDPVGVPFYVMSPTPPDGAPEAKSDVFDPDKAQHIRWNELSTTAQDAAITFFGKHFGWTQEGGMPMGAMGDYKFVQADGVGIGAIMIKPPAMPVSAWLFYIGVDDIDRATGAVTDHGGQVVNGPMEIPGGDYATVAVDPQGAAFGLVGPRKN
jgi:predicted enzyme related to lactoylglutathione lyase